MKYSEFTRLYPVQKTLRFELIPQGETERHIRQSHDEGQPSILEKDEERASKFQAAKQLIDVYHRHHIDEALALVDFKALDCLSHMETIQSIIRSPHFTDPETREEAEKKRSEAEKKIREAIAGVLKGSLSKKATARYSAKQKKALEAVATRYKTLTSKDLFNPSKNTEFRTVVVEAGHSESEFDETIGFFKGFSTYFTGFNQNRENMYSDEEEATAIAYRIVHDNLPRFLDNIRVYESLRPHLSKSEEQAIRKRLEIRESLSSIFSLGYFEKCLNQKGIEYYNKLIGGFFVEGESEKRQGLNEWINLYNQKHPDTRLPRFQPLYKQILSETNSVSFRPEPFETDQELLTALQDFWKHHIEHAINESDRSHFNVLKSFTRANKQLAKMKESDYERIFVNAKRLSALSHQAFGDWAILRNALSEHHHHQHPDETQAQQEKSISSLLARPFYSLAELDRALSFYFEHVLQGDTIKQRTSLRDFFAAAVFDDPGTAESSATPAEEKDLVGTIEETYRDLAPLFKDHPESDELHKDKETVRRIKSFLDALMNLKHHLSYLHTEASNTEKNEDFYGLWDSCNEALSPLPRLYNKVRNRLTRKPFSEEKLKLTFDRSTLLDGWDINKEEANLSVLLEKDGLYYLAIMDKAHNKLFSNLPKPSSQSVFNKLNYKLLPNPYMMLPKVFFSDKGKKDYSPPDNIIKIYDKKSFTKGDQFKKKDLHKLIDFYKASIRKNSDWDVFQFKFRPTKDYNDIAEFYNEVQAQGYATWWSQVDEALVMQWVSEGKLYLFQLYNKDFSPYSKGKPNLHTIYWRHLFEPANRNPIVYQLNGQAELFFRPASISYTEKQRKEGHHAKELKGKFQYPILKDRRYSMDKFFLHVPITMNFHSQSTEFIDPFVHDYIRKNKKVKIIGIDRGERNLLYLTLIDHKGNILKQESLNSIRNEKVGVDIDYHAKLDAREKERQQARQNWDVIENIKELKEGYLSQIVHRIAQIMVENEAILVMENLNAGFKRGRFKVEKQVYQKFEKMLIDKLNYLVFKDRKPKEPGGSLNAFQLTGKFTSFQKLGNQSGMIFYVPASYTSKIDPVTGFYNFLRPKAGTIPTNKAFFSRFDSIRYNPAKGYFEFEATYGQFVPSHMDAAKRKSKKTLAKIAQRLADTTWVICSHQEAERYRMRRSKNGSFSYERYDCNEKIKSVLQDAGIAFEDGSDLKQQIVQQNQASFFKDLIEALQVLLALRYNNGKAGAEEKDYILSPVADPRTGRFFNSLEADPTFPVDADANGAYNIAKKGLLLCMKIQETPEGSKIDRTVSQLEWLDFLWNRT